MKNFKPHEKWSISRRSFAKGSISALAVSWLGSRLDGEPLRTLEGNSRFINPMIGASTSDLLGAGKTFPGSTTPFGIVQLSPDTITGGPKGPGHPFEGDNAPGYSYEHTTIEGFSFTHMSGVGWYGDFGNLQVMPTTGPMKLDSGRINHPDEGWRSTYSHANESAEANYYAVMLDRYGIHAELTATPRAGMLRFSYPKNETARIQLNLARRIGGLSRGLPFELEHRARRKDGEYRWSLVRFNPFRDEMGRVVRWYATGTDIDDRVKAEERTRNENQALREQIDRDSMFEDIVGSSEVLRKVLRQVTKVALSDSTVLILGETGTGKELIARAIHKRSKRASRAFIGVNCAAIPPSLIASELFGYEKGAFTGATQRRLGRFESASGGTLFLDEVGDLPLDIQIALLRVLQEREIQRVGANTAISVDVRMLAATHRDLDVLVAEGKFREDLLYRLNVVPIVVPSLRERADDLPLLVEYFITRFGKNSGKKFRAIDDKTLNLFRAYSWPGNVRELQNVIERAVILSEGDICAVDETWLKRPSSHRAASPAFALSGVLHKREKEMIEAALAASNGRVSGPTGAAAKLGIPTKTLDSKIKRLGINKYQFRASGTEPVA